MKKIFYLFCVILFSSCSQFEKQPKCNDLEVQELVIEILEKNIAESVENEFNNDISFRNNENYSLYKPIISNSSKYIKQFQFKLHNIRTDQIYKEIKKCGCIADLNSIEQSKIIDLIPEDIVNGDFRILGVSPVINYTAQITDEGKVYVTVNNLEELQLHKKNVFAKVAYDLVKKMKDLEYTNNYKNSEYVSENYSDNYSDVSTNNLGSNDDLSGGYYFVDASPNYPVYFYKTPNKSDRKKARFTTFEKIYVSKISGDFGYVEFTNSENKKSSGWILLSQMTRE